MVDVKRYMERLIPLLKERFGTRLAYVGLQGSYQRGEANENSDIDVMAVIDGLTAEDLTAYRAAVQSAGNGDKACRFLCGRTELACWNPLELCHLLHTTTDWYGELAPMLPAWTDADVRRFVQLSLCNLYHELCHRRIYGSREKNESRLPGTCRPVFFILQNLHYLRTGDFCQTHEALLKALGGADRAMLRTSMALKNGEPFEFDAVFAQTLDWCSRTLESVKTD